MPKKTKNEKHIESLLESALSNVRLVSPAPPLITAIEEQNTELVKRLISEGADPCLKTSGTFPLFTATAHNNIEIMEFLILSGANVDQFTPDLKWTSLINSAYWDHVNACRLLLKHGADHNFKSSHGYTALDIAKVNGRQSVEEILKKLPYIK